MNIGQEGRRSVSAIKHEFSGSGSTSSAYNTEKRTLDDDEEAEEDMTRLFKAGGRRGD